MNDESKHIAWKESMRYCIKAATVQQFARKKIRFAIFNKSVHKLAFSVANSERRHKTEMHIRSHRRRRGRRRHHVIVKILFVYISICTFLRSFCVLNKMSWHISPTHAHTYALAGKKPNGNKSNVAASEKQAVTESGRAHNMREIWRTNWTNTHTCMQRDEEIVCKKTENKHIFYCLRCVVWTEFRVILNIKVIRCQNNSNDKLVGTTNRK